jgi:hypothetical protein
VLYQKYRAIPKLSLKPYSWNISVGSSLAETN